MQKIKAKEGICPICNEKLDYGCYEFDDNEIWFDVHCPKCDRHFREYCKVTYDETYIDVEE